MDHSLRKRIVRYRPFFANNIRSIVQEDCEMSEKGRYEKRKKKYEKEKTRAKNKESVNFYIIKDFTNYDH